VKKFTLVGLITAALTVLMSVVALAGDTFLMK